MARPRACTVAGDPMARPYIDCPRRDGPDRRGVILVGIEGRIEVNQVDALGVDPTHDVQIVPHPDRAIAEICLPHIETVDAAGDAVQGGSPQYTACATRCLPQNNQPRPTQNP